MKVRHLLAVLVAVAIWCPAAPSLALKSARNGASPVQVTLTDTGIHVEPALPDTGSTTFVVINRSSVKRGLVVYGTDNGGSDGFRYSPLIRPGQSLKMNCWLFPGRSYHLKDYTDASVVGTRKRFTTHNRTSLSLPSRAGFDRIPSAKPNKAYVTLSDAGMKVGSVPSGCARFIVENRSAKPRGFYISGKDAAGTPVLYHTKKLQPGQSAAISTWLYEGQTYAGHDYTACTVEPGRGLQFTSEFSKDIQTR